MTIMPILLDTTTAITQFLNNSFHGWSLNGRFVSAKPSNPRKLGGFIFEKPVVEVWVEVILESASLSSKTYQVRDLSFPRKDLEDKHAKGVDIAFLCEATCGGIFRSQVAHGSTGFQG